MREIGDAEALRIDKSIRHTPVEPGTILWYRQENKRLREELAHYQQFATEYAKEQAKFLKKWYP
jgi:hypothetical protein